MCNVRKHFRLLLFASKRRHEVALALPRATTTSLQFKILSDYSRYNARLALALFLSRKSHRACNYRTLFKHSPRLFIGGSLLFSTFHRCPGVRNRTRCMTIQYNDGQFTATCPVSQFLNTNTLYLFFPCVTLCGFATRAYLRAR